MKFAILTKFAVSIDSDNIHNEYNREVINDENWINKRFDLFNRYCRPSVAAQTCKNFDWYFLVSPNFKNWNLDHTRELEKHGKILWIKEWFKDDLFEVGSYLKYDGWLTTIRLDSDDMLANDFMFELSNNVGEYQGFFSFRRGCITDGKTFYDQRIINNPFVAFTELAGKNIQTVLCQEHRYVFKNQMENTKYDWKHDGPPMWATVCHDLNLVNNIKTKTNTFTVEFIKNRFTFKE